MIFRMNNFGASQVFSLCFPAKWALEMANGPVPLHHWLQTSSILAALIVGQAVLAVKAVLCLCRSCKIFSPEPTGFNVRHSSQVGAKGKTLRSDGILASANPTGHHDNKTDALIEQLISKDGAGPLSLAQNFRNKN